VVRLQPPLFEMPLSSKHLMQSRQARLLGVRIVLASAHAQGRTNLKGQNQFLEAAVMVFSLWGPQVLYIEGPPRSHQRLGSCHHLLSVHMNPLQFHDFLKYDEELLRRQFFPVVAAMPLPPWSGSFLPVACCLVL